MHACKYACVCVCKHVCMYVFSLYRESRQIMKNVWKEMMLHNRENKDYYVYTYMQMNTHIHTNAHLDTSTHKSTHVCTHT